jgi:hypothetical protein
VFRFADNKLSRGYRDRSLVRPLRCNCRQGVGRPRSSKGQPYGYLLNRLQNKCAHAGEIQPLAVDGSHRIGLDKISDEQVYSSPRVHTYLFSRILMVVASRGVGIRTLAFEDINYVQSSQPSRGANRTYRLEQTVGKRGRQQVPCVSDKSDQSLAALARDTGHVLIETVSSCDGT